MLTRVELSRARHCVLSCDVVKDSVSCSLVPTRQGSHTTSLSSVRIVSCFKFTHTHTHLHTHLSSSTHQSHFHNPIQVPDTSQLLAS